MNAISRPLPTPGDLATERLAAAVESAIVGIQQRLPNLASDGQDTKWSASDLDPTRYRKPQQQRNKKMNNPNTETSALVADLQRHACTLRGTLKNKKGPASPEAKQRVKYNALRHGFTGQVLIMTPEEREHFDAFVQGMMTDLAPVGTHETFLANSMAEEAWRLNQIRARCANLSAVGDFDGAGDNYRPMEGQNPGLETNGIESAVIDSVVARDHSKQLALMSLYGQRTQRAYE
jgi:hypothetical protein